MIPSWLLMGAGNPAKTCYIPPPLLVGLPTLKKDEETLGSAHEESKEAGLRYLGGQLFTFLSGRMLLGVEDPGTEKLPACNLAIRVFLWVSYIDIGLLFNGTSGDDNFYQGRRVRKLAIRPTSEQQQYEAL